MLRTIYILSITDKLSISICKFKNETTESV